MNSRKYNTDRITDNKQVCNEPCLLLEAGATSTWTTSVLTPDAVSQNGGAWVDLQNCIDESTLTSATITNTPGTYTDAIEFEFTVPKYCVGVRYAATVAGLGNERVVVDYWDGSDWVEVYNEQVTWGLWKTALFTTSLLISKIRFRFLSESGLDDVISFSEFDFLLTKLFDVGLYNGFDTNDELKYRLSTIIGGRLFYKFDMPIYFDRGLYAKFTLTTGTVFLKYLVIGKDEWSIQQTLPLSKLITPKLRRFVQPYKLLKGWFTK